MRNGQSSRGSGSSLGESPGQRFASRPQSPAPSPGSARARWTHILAAQQKEAAKRAGEINSAGKTSSADAGEPRTPARLRVCACMHTRVLRASAGTHGRTLSACVHAVGRAGEPASGLGGASRVLEMCPHPLIALL